MNRIVVAPIVILLLGSSAGALMGSKALEWRRGFAELKDEIRDYDGIGVYPTANARILAAGARPEVVLIGASHTRDWGETEKRFPNVHVVTRGIGGQRVPQYLLRFRQDVLELKPRVVVIEGCEINVSSGVPLRSLVDSYESMVELARLHGIEPILATILPVDSAVESRSPGLNDGVRRLNDVIRKMATRQSVRLVDYYAAVEDERGMLAAADTTDGRHGGPRSYDRMAETLARVLDEALAKKAVLRAAGDDDRSDPRRIATKVDPDVWRTSNTGASVVGPESVGAP
jgi:lysophospholipase L1-like esterase